MDSNQYRRGTGVKYKNSSLSVGESIEFLGRINRRAERKCIKCGCRFLSEGYHNRKCPKCSAREEYLERKNALQEPIVYRTHASGVRSTAFHSEVGE